MGQKENAKVSDNPMMSTKCRALITHLWSGDQQQKGAAGNAQSRVPSQTL
jgi:hypothetical protein